MSSLRDKISLPQIKAVEELTARRSDHVCPERCLAIDYIIQKMEDEEKKKEIKRVKK